jgi:hypothetical protein
MKDLYSDRWFFAVIGIALATVTILSFTGWLAGATAPDTSGYFFDLDWPSLWGQPRHPLYSVMVSVFGPYEKATRAIVTAQLALHLLSCVLLYCGARSACIGKTGAFSLAVSGVLAQVVLQYGRLVAPETPAISFLILAFAGTLAATASRRAFNIWIVPVAVAAGIAYSLRPIMLPAIATLPLLWLILVWHRKDIHIILRAVAMVGILAIPFFGQAIIRWVAVDDFNIVSFGGFQMSAMAGYMLDDKVIASLPDNVRDTAQRVLAVRNAAESDGRVMRTPLNSSGERSFVSAAVSYFDIYARSYDNFLVGISALQAPGETWVAFNQRLMRFSFATIRTAPLRWLAWIVGGTSRTVGRMLVTNVALILSAALFLLVWLRQMLRSSKQTPLGPNDVSVVALVALAWTATCGPLGVLVTFPAARYIDTSALLLSAIPLVGMLALARAAKCSESERPLV